MNITRQDIFKYASEFPSAYFEQFPPPRSKQQQETEAITKPKAATKESYRITTARLHEESK